MHKAAHSLQGDCPATLRPEDSRALGSDLISPPEDTKLHETQGLALTDPFSSPTSGTQLNVGAGFPVGKKLILRKHPDVEFECTRFLKFDLQEIGVRRIQQDIPFSANSC